MARITYVDSDGRSLSVEVENGSNVMRGALSAGVSGIEAICGGQCVCATCHCLVDEAWLNILPAVGELENEMLDEVTVGRSPRSRLSCQIEVTNELDGLIVHVPQSQ